MHSRSMAVALAHLVFCHRSIAYRAWVDGPLCQRQQDTLSFGTGGTTGREVAFARCPYHVHSLRQTTRPTRLRSRDRGLGSRLMGGYPPRAPLSWALGFAI
ncbi:hypothetical protein C8R46DRAFT_1124978 [Mycena filopes]|nr:hypothetical protein C8R46DRAFT_1124978 [Mycena filopes]